MVDKSGVTQICCHEANHMLTITHINLLKKDKIALNLCLEYVSSLSPMGRIIAIDYGLKRVGLAVTDPLQLIATPLTTVPTTNILDFLLSYIEQETINLCVIGVPVDLKNQQSPIIYAIAKFIAMLKKRIPHLQIFKQDERYTSRLAIASLVEGGFKKKDRQKKENIDKISATIILQSFLRTYNP